MSAPAPFLPGDILPALSMPDAAGAPFELSQQAIAGVYRFIVLGRSAPASALAAVEARGAILLTVMPGKPDGKPQDDGPRRLFDPDGKLFAGLGLTAAGAAIISPRGRLHFVSAAADAVEAAIASLPDAEATTKTRRGGAPVLLIPGVLEPEFVARLLAHWRAGEKLQDRVASAADGTGAGLVTGIKRRSDVFLDDRRLYETFQKRMERRVLPEMWRAFRFRAASFEAPRIGCYAAAAAGAFGAHRDNRTPFTAHRRFAMSLNLNTGEYGGGTLRFPEFGAEDYEPEAGGCAIFCCDLLHEARPVTAGERFAIFTFFTDAEGAQQERKLMAEAAARGQPGVTLR